MIFNSSKELAEFFEVSESAVSRWLAAGLPHEIGPKFNYVYHLDQVIEWLLSKSPRHVRFVEQKLKAWEEEKGK